MSAVLFRNLVKLSFSIFKTGCGDKSTSSLGEHSGDREADKLSKSAIHLFSTFFFVALLILSMHDFHIFKKETQSTKYNVSVIVQTWHHV